MKKKTSCRMVYIVFVLKNGGILYYFPRAAETKYQSLNVLKPQTFILPWFWRWKFQSQGVFRATPRRCLKDLGENLTWPLPAPGGPRHSSACGCITPTPASISSGFFSVCLHTALSCLCLSPLP